MATNDNPSDGGLLFPTLPEHDSRTGLMTLRDYFAAKAMAGIVGSIDSEANYQRLRTHASRDGLSVSEWIARDAYKQADAMLKARSPTPSQGA